MYVFIVTYYPQLAGHYLINEMNSSVIKTTATATTSVTSSSGASTVH